jgi:hypothetical protein
VLSKCKHDILFMSHFCALKEYLNLCHTTNRYTCVKYVLSHTVNYQRVSIPFAIVIIMAAVQQHKQYNKLPNYVSGTTQRHNKCLKFSIWSQNVSWRTVWYRYNLVATNQQNWLYCCLQSIYTLFTVYHSYCCCEAALMMIIAKAIETR